MNALRNIFPYGLNEWARKHGSKVPVGKLFFSIARTKQGSARYRSNNDYLKNNTLIDFFTNINEIIQHDMRKLFV